jgi:tRNA/rRNA methyltransferase
MTLPDTSISINAEAARTGLTSSSDEKVEPIGSRRLRFVLVESSRPGNIGAVARAMKTMGFCELFLVRPRFADALTAPEAIAFASGAQDVLANARIVQSFSEALEGCSFAAAVSARLREFSPPVTTPRLMAGYLMQPELSTFKTAIVFGNERFGLPNDIVEKCNFLINIPANPLYSSLNLAQAAQIIAYECRLAGIGDTGDDINQITEAAGATLTTGDIKHCEDEGRHLKLLEKSTPDSSIRAMNARTTNIGFQGAPAVVGDIDAMFQHLESALIAIDFLDPANPKKLMSRLRRLFSRTQLEAEEVNIFRGIARQILKSKKTH